jgi:hypothetical protein
MNRTAAVSFLAAEYPALMSEYKVSADDTAAGLKGPIDNTFRALGFEESALSEATSIGTSTATSSVVTLLRYFALRHFLSIAASKVDITVGTPQEGKQQSQAFRSIEKLLKAAQSEVSNLGLLDFGEFQLGRLTLDFLEPIPALGESLS